MKKIDITQIADPLIQQPFTGLSLEFLQNGNKEMIQALCRNIITNKGLTYSATTPYFISFFTTTFTSDGAVFYGGELFIMLENSASLTYAVISTTPDVTADPVIFTDLVSRNVHNNRYLGFTNTLSGSLFAIANIVNVSVRNVIPFINITPAANWSVPATYTSSPNVFQYRKNLNNEVEFRGFVQNTDSGATSTLFTLPAGFRPTNVKEFTCRSASTISGGGSSTTRAVIFPSGIVNVYLVTSDYNCFDTVRFSLD